jgi:hypothetical protein
MTNTDPLLTGPEAAALAGIAPATWRSYVARGYVPPADDPDDGRPANRRSPRWLTSTVERFAANRIGQGRRGKGVEISEAGRADVATALAARSLADLRAMAKARGLGGLSRAGRGAIVAELIKYDPETQRQVIEASRTRPGRG